MLVDDARGNGEGFDGGTQAAGIAADKGRLYSKSRSPLCQHVAIRLQQRFVRANLISTRVRFEAHFCSSTETPGSLLKGILYGLLVMLTRLKWLETAQFACYSYRS